MVETLSSRSARSGSNRGTVLILLVTVVALFIIVVGHGWLHLLLPITGRNAFLSGVIALLLTLMAILLARYIGEKRSDNQIVSEEQGVHRAIDWILFYPFLFLISALGSMNTAFYQFEGASVLQNDIDEAQLMLRQLETASSELLGDRAYQARLQRVNSLLVSLKPEIVDDSRGDNYCGVGSSASAIIRDIREVLPNFRVPAGVVGRTKCNEIDEQAIYTGLEQQARQMLETGVDPVLANVRTSLGTGLAQLQRAETGLDFAGNGALNEQSYFAAQEALKDAATAYSDSRARVAAHVTADAAKQLPAMQRLDISRSLNLGSIFSLIPTLVSRLSYGATWVYIFAAIALDVALVFLFMQVTRASQGFTPLSPSAKSTDPKFLWVSPTS